MKQTISCILWTLMLFSLSACGGQPPAEPTGAPATWQEQYDLGERYLSEGSYAQAALAFAAAIEIDPKKPEAYAGLADACLGGGETEKARQALEQGLAATGDAGLGRRLGELDAASSTAASAPPEGAAPDEAEIQSAQDIDTSRLPGREHVTVAGVPYWGAAYEALLERLWDQAPEGVEGYDRAEDPSYADALARGYFSTKDGVAISTVGNGTLYVSYGASMADDPQGEAHRGLVTGLAGVALGDSKATALKKLGLSAAAAAFLEDAGEVLIWRGGEEALVSTFDSLNAWQTVALEFLESPDGAGQRLRVDLSFSGGVLYQVQYSIY